MKSSCIAIITDFGSRDYYTGVMKGVIKSINPGAELIDITNDATPFSVRNAQFILASSCRFFPAGTIFLVVVDPGVGSSRRALAAGDGTYRYVMPDNGIISAVWSGTTRCRTLPIPVGEGIASTFHGRDVFAPAAARLSREDPLESLGEPCSDPVQLPYPPFNEKNGMLEGEVLHIDTFGNIITSLPESRAEEANQGRLLVKGKLMEKRLIGHFDELDRSAAGLYRGSAGFLELAIKQGSLAARDDVRVGDTITVKTNDR